MKTCLGEQKIYTSKPAHIVDKTLSPIRVLRMLLFLEALSVLCKVCLTVKQMLVLFCFSQAIIFYFLFFFRMSLIIWKWSEAFLAANPAQQNPFRTFLCASGELADNLGFSSILMQGLSAGVHSFGPFPFILMSEKVVFALWENVFVDWP